MFERLRQASMELAGLSIVIMLSCVQAKPCQPGQERFGNSCYQLLTETFTWEEASQACANIDAGLVIPDSLQEHQFIWEMFTRKVTESGNLWIGCSDAEEEDRWLQAGDGDHECTYFNWAEGEPHPAYKDREDCAGMWGGHHGGFWNDLPCTNSYNAMCESPAVPSMSCLLTYDGRGFFTAHCLTDHILKDSSTSSVAWALVCRDEPRCRSFSLRPASRGALMSCQLYPDTEMNTEDAKSCQYYYF